MIEVLLIRAQIQTTSATATQAGNPFIVDVQLGAILGFSATLLGSFGVWVLNKRNRKTRLRRALIAELQKQKEKIESVIESLDTENPIDYDDKSIEYEVSASELPPADSLPMTVYNSNASNLGDLPSGEIEDIVDYYSSLQAQRATIEAIRKGENVLSADKRDLHKEMPGLNEKRQKLISKLRDDE